MVIVATEVLPASGLVEEEEAVVISQIYTKSAYCTKKRKKDSAVKKAVASDLISLVVVA